MIKKMWVSPSNLNNPNKNEVILFEKQKYKTEIPVFVTDEDPFVNVRKIVGEKALKGGYWRGSDCIISSFLVKIIFLRIKIKLVSLFQCYDIIRMYSYNDPGFRNITFFNIKRFI